MGYYLFLIPHFTSHDSSHRTLKYKCHDCCHSQVANNCVLYLYVIMRLLNHSGVTKLLIMGFTYPVWRLKIGFDLVAPFRNPYFRNPHSLSESCDQY